VHGRRVTCPLHNLVIDLDSGEAVAPDTGCARLRGKAQWRPALARAEIRREGGRLMDAAATGVKTTCPYCGVGCGVIATPGLDGEISIRGDPEHPANLGRLCSKGAALGATLGLEGRLLTPLVDGAETGWEQALDHVARGFSETIDRHGPGSVAFYVSGQLLTEDYYVINKLAKGFVGAANIDTNSRLCMASSVAGHKRAFGADTVPGCYEDLEQADLIVLVGSNAAWCHPVRYERMVAAKARDPHKRIVVIDPRRTDTCDAADLHLPLRSGSDGVLFNGLLAHLDRAGAANAAFLAEHTIGAAETLAAVAGQTIAETASMCGLPEGNVQLFFDWFARTGTVVTLYSQGVNQSTSGTDKVSAILNAHLLTGRIGRPGMGPFSLTGQPNAMGGREVGGLANQLAAHMEFEDPVHRDRVQQFWRSPTIADRAGLKAVEMFEAIGVGRIKAVWIRATNPLVSLPDSDRARAALAKCSLVVVSDCLASTDTTRAAHVLLPATTWGEKSGTVTNSERRLSRQRDFLPAPGEARSDWRIVCDLARRMGSSGFDYGSVADIFREHAALSGFENGGARAFDISGLSNVSEIAYATLAPVQWPVTADAPYGTARLCGSGRFCTGDRRARSLPVRPRAPVSATGVGFPLQLNTGRVRDHWHTMTRTAKAARLNAHVFEPYAELHPDDADRFGLSDGLLARLQSAWGAMVARVRLSAGIRRGAVFAPMHWSDTLASTGRVNALVNSVVDPISGQPESKHTPIRVEPHAARWHAFALNRRQLTQPKLDYWVAGKGEGYWRQELAGDVAPEDWQVFARERLGGEVIDCEWIAFRDFAKGRHRFAMVRNGRLEGCMFVAPDHRLPSRTWLAGLFASEGLSPEARLSLMAGAPRDPNGDIDPIVCSCFSVGRKTIHAAIEGGAGDVETIGARVKAGANCGSCKPELGQILARTRLVSHAR